MIIKLSKCLFIFPLPPPVHGSSMMSRYLQESDLINREFDCDFVNLSTSRRMDEIGKRSLRKVFRFVDSYLKVASKLFSGHYDLCYLAITCHGIGFLKDAPFVLLCKLFGCKVVLHQHNKGLSGDVHRFLYRWLFPLVYKHTHVILLSWRLYDDICPVVKREQVLVCPNGIPMPLHQTTVSKKGNAIPQVLFLSNLQIEKGVFVLLNACRLLKDRGLAFRCVFVGSETKEIDAIVFQEKVKELGLEDMVSYVGRKYNEEKEAYWGSSDLFVFPTYYSNECFPVVLLEAMQHGLPVIATNEGGIPDIVEDGKNGFVVSRRSSEELAARIEVLLNDVALRRNMGDAGFEKYCNFFTKEHFEMQMCECLHRSINS